MLLQITLSFEGIVYENLDVFCISVRACEKSVWKMKKCVIKSTTFATLQRYKKESTEKIVSAWHLYNV